MRTANQGQDSGQKLVALAILVAPFALNDFANIWVHDFAVWLSIDYFLVKGFVIAAAWVMLRRGVLSWGDLGFVKLAPGPFVAWSLVMTAVGLILDQYAYDLLDWLPTWKLGGYPGEPGTWLYTFDLWFGLSLVALTEEFIARGLAWNALRPRMGVVSTYLVSSLIFGLMHWSLGLHAIIVTGIIGAAFMTCVHRTGSILPTLVAHFVVNFVYFWG